MLSNITLSYNEGKSLCILHGLKDFRSLVFDIFCLETSCSMRFHIYLGAILQDGKSELDIKRVLI